MKAQRQPEVNIGMIGHVDHGKTTLTQALTGVWTDRHSEEIKRGISIKLGYADATFYKCGACPEPEAFVVQPKCPKCGGDARPLRTVSFVDSPGHETLMATMLSGAAIMDGALLLVSAVDKCPQPQTREHLMALEIIGVKSIIVVQNKIDLVPEERAVESYKEIQAFVKGTIAEKAPILPVSAQQKTNIDVLVQHIEKLIPTPQRDPAKEPRMYVARSFDINKPGSEPGELRGGVVGGSVIQGHFSVDDEIEITPGRRVEEHGRARYESIRTKITGIMAGGHPLKEVNPGGLCALSTLLDPSLTKGDSLAGRLVGRPGKLPQPLATFTMQVHLLDRAVGTAEDLKVDQLRTREQLMLNVGTATTVGVVTSAREADADVTLKLPVVAEKGVRVAISRRIGNRWRLIGYGVVEK